MNDLNKQSESVGFIGKIPELNQIVIFRMINP
jgi:hypothetical protein